MMENSSIERSQTNQQKSLQNFIYQLIRDRPLIMIGGLWLIVAIAATYGFVGVFSAGKNPEPQVASSPTTTFEEIQPEESTSQPTPKAEKPVQTVNPAQTVPEETLPLWLFAGIILACGTGSLLVLNNSKQGNSRRKTLVRPKRKTKPRASNIKGVAAHRERNLRQKVKKKPKKSRPPAKRSAIAKRPSLNPKNKRNRPQSPLSPNSSRLNPKPVVTVLPPEEINRLDKTKESLADTLDLRKERSLSSLMARQRQIK